MKKYLSLFICLLGLNSFSQEMVKSVDLGISKNAGVFQVVEKDKKQVSLFFSAKKNVLSVRFDENFNVIDSLKAEKPSTDYDDIVGYSLSGNKYYTYWSSSNGKELLSQCFDFDAKKVDSKPIKFALEKEKIIKRITVNNVFYTITIIKGTGILNFYILNDGNLEKKSIDLTSRRFLGSDNKVTTLFDIISHSTPYELPYSFETISTETPPSLALSANKHKIYVQGNKLLFTLDDNSRYTQTFTVDLTDFSSTAKMYMQPVFPDDSKASKVDGELTGYYCDSNSFFLNDKMIQIKNNSDFMKLSLKDTEGNEIKQFLINAQDISFKNSDINQETGTYKSLRVLDKSNQLIRKIYGANSAVSLYENEGKIYMILGGVSNMRKDNVLFLTGAYGLTGTLIGMALYSNYSISNLNSYRERKVIYINCLFDSNFNHLEGEVKKTAFDALREFWETKENFIAPVVFKLNANLYYGGYDKVEGNYMFYTFKD